MLAISRTLRIALLTAMIASTGASLRAQTSTPAPIPPDKAPAAMTFPGVPGGEGFKVTLFAGEPDVKQPIAFDIDARGRLWVAECYSYPKWAETGHDRILIFEDTDGDGRYDSRTVFWDKGQYLTGLVVGFGGVYICNAPYVQFIPDKNGDDVPDGDPIVVLDGWTYKGVHNVVNGLTWGPDGWLYGMNGITAPSTPGVPGTPDEKRPNFANGVWRYHPVTKQFEIVAHGTTNPWGLDFDEYGQMFITNCVIKHIFHVIPGARYVRMFGQDLNPYAYDLIESCADHIHWGGGKWTDSRGGKGDHDKAGGGHAHAGCMIYLGDNWPSEYRGRVFTGNIHGHRLNQDVLEHSKSGYVVKHGQDFMFANDEWAFFLEAKYGPDGGVYVIDWVEDGECHGHEAHRESGRVFKVTYGDVKPVKVDLYKLSDTELAKLQLHRNAWYVRQSRRILQERVAEGRDLSSARAMLADLIFKRSVDDRPGMLNCMWTLHATGGLSDEQLTALLAHQEPYVRAWVIRLQCEDGKVPSAMMKSFIAMAKNDPSPVVRLELASILQRLDVDARWPIAEALAAHAEDAEDPNIPVMLWLGMEPLADADRARFLGIATKTQIPILRQYIARRIAFVPDVQPPLRILQAKAE